MSVKTRLYDSLFWLIAGTLYAFSVVDGVLAATVFEVSRGTLLRLTAFFVALFLLALFSRRTGLAFLGGVLLFAVVAAVSLASGGFAARWLDDGRELFGELSLFLAGRAPYREQYSEALGLALCFVTSFLTALTTRLRFSFFILAVAGAWVFAAPIYNGWGTSPLALALMTLSFVLLLAKKQNLIALGPGSGVQAGAGYSLWLIPLVSAVFALAWSLPTPEFLVAGEFGPPDLSAVADRIFSGLAPTAIGTFTTEGAPLGGPVALSEEHVMDVEASEPLYLSGSVRDYYDGFSWSVSDPAMRALTPEEGNAYDTVAYPADLADAQRYYMRFYGMEPARVTITPGEVPTRLVLSPPYRQSLETERRRDLSASVYGAIESDRILEENDSYAQEYLSFDYENPYMIALLRGVIERDAGEASSLTQAERAAFLRLPDNISGRVRATAAELTEGLANDYDRMTALAAYLARFPYTLTPNPVPGGRELVDHFLFEGRQGYCVYYASALAVMGRLEGIPTRYVEGYITPEEPDENGVYAVSGQLAHAWAEAYFEGFGWVIFEATRPYAGVGGDEMAGAGGFYYEEETIYEEPAITLDLDALEAERRAARFALFLRWVIGVLVVIALVGVTVMLLRLRFRLRFERLESMPNREAAMAWFGMILRQAAAYHLAIRGEETALAYANRMKERLKFRDYTIAGLAEIFSRAAYSENEITGEDCAALKECHRQLLIRLLAERRPVGRLVDRYVLLRY